ncbi:hypothetical protein K449DRAFT_432597 [Hypoxylon sp. EC38]|nr:hypothetical protein K449DRAFT_432597 [Hypoxylon sp. EC38]
MQPQTTTKPEAKQQQQQQPKLDKGKQVPAYSLTWPKPPEQQQQTSLVAQQALDMMTQQTPQANSQPTVAGPSTEAVPKTPLPSQKAWPIAKLTPTRVKEQPAIPRLSTQAVAESSTQPRTPEGPSYAPEASEPPQTPKPQRVYSAFPEMRVEGGELVPGSPQASEAPPGSEHIFDYDSQEEFPGTAETADPQPTKADRRILKPKSRLKGKMPASSLASSPSPPPPTAPEKGKAKEESAGRTNVEADDEDEYEDKVLFWIEQGFDDEEARIMVDMEYECKKSEGSY